MFILNKIQPLYSPDTEEQGRQYNQNPDESRSSIENSKSNVPEEENPHRGGFIAPPGSNYAAATLNGISYGTGFHQDKYRGYYGEINAERTFGTHYVENYGNPDYNWDRPNRDLVPDFPREEENTAQVDYRLSDERIREEVSKRLGEDTTRGISKIEFHVDKGNVILRGEVDNKEIKYHVEDILQSVPGVTNMENHLCVAKHSAVEDFAKALAAGLGDVIVGNNPRRKK
jgi:hypothetical protein